MHSNTKTKEQPTHYRGIELGDIPSGMGGTLPAAIAARHEDGTATVICLHHEYSPNWVLTVKQVDIKPWTHGKVKPHMRQFLDARLPDEKVRHALVVAVGIIQSFIDIAKEGKVAEVSIGTFKTVSELEELSKKKS